MKPVSYKRHRFPSDVIRHTVWLYFRFTLSLRDVEELLAHRGIEGQLRDDPLLDAQVRQGFRVQREERPPCPDRSLASGRDGGQGQRQTHVAVARGR
jgi:hypothetical protein